MAPPWGLAPLLAFRELTPEGLSGLAPAGSSALSAATDFDRFQVSGFVTVSDVDRRIVQAVSTALHCRARPFPDVSESALTPIRLSPPALSRPRRRTNLMYAP
jgi:hypothetical protein